MEKKIYFVKYVIKRVDHFTAQIDTFENLEYAVKAADDLKNNIHMDCISIGWMKLNDNLKSGLETETMLYIKK